MIVTGNPGTGKTTVARLIARYLHAFGVLPRDRFVEKNGLEMKGKYVGHTTHTVKEAVADAMGGTLFLDEACVARRDAAPPPAAMPPRQAWLRTRLRVCASARAGGQRCAR